NTWPPSPYISKLVARPIRVLLLAGGACPSNKPPPLAVCVCACACVRVRVCVCACACARVLALTPACGCPSRLGRGWRWTPPPALRRPRSTAASVSCNRFRVVSC
ncbi:jg27110, partial [Pararge aegeria aegeria]